MPSLYLSPVLQQLDKELRPKPSTICEVCPASMWYVQTRSIRCFCTVIHGLTYQSDEPTSISACDGEVQANLKRLDEEEKA